MADACTAQSWIEMPQAEPLLMGIFPAEQTEQTVADVWVVQPKIAVKQSGAKVLPVVRVV